MTSAAVPVTIARNLIAVRINDSFIDVFREMG
jgi:hypothetical protein